MGTPSYYSILTADVRYDKDLPPNAKLLYSEITALTTMRGYCGETNKYFAELYGVSPTSISNWISILKAKGYIDVEMIQHEENHSIKERRIYTTIKNENSSAQDNTYTENFNGGYPKNLGEGIQKILKDNNINTLLNNNIYINNDADFSKFLQTIYNARKKIHQLDDREFSPLTGGEHVKELKNLNKSLSLEEIYADYQFYLRFNESCWAGHLMKYFLKNFDKIHALRVAGEPPKLINSKIDKKNGYTPIYRKVVTSG